MALKTLNRMHRHSDVDHASCVWQAAAAQAPQLTAEEARKLRQERDPNFGAKDRKRKAGLGFQESQEGQEAKRPKAAQVTPRNSSAGSHSEALLAPAHEARICRLIPGSCAVHIRTMPCGTTLPGGVD